MDEVVPMTGRFVIPEVVSTHFHIREGDVVADFGAGRGFFVPVLAKLVGKDGRVHACEIQRGLVEAVGELARREGLVNVEVHWCDLEEINGSKLHDNSVDVGIFVNTLFQIEDKSTTVQELKRALRPGGKLFVIDWTESFSGLGPQPEQVTDADTARALFETEGFTYERSFDAGDHHYGLAFRL